jgi:hypothetical protein
MKLIALFSVLATSAAVLVGYASNFPPVSSRSDVHEGCNTKYQARRVYHHFPHKPEGLRYRPFMYPISWCVHHRCGYFCRPLLLSFCVSPNSCCPWKITYLINGLIAVLIAMGRPMALLQAVKTPFGFPILRVTSVSMHKAWNVGINL